MCVKLVDMLVAKTKFLLATLCLAIGMVLPLSAQEPGEDEAADAPLDLSEFPGMLVDDVVVPVPSEIFSIMGKLGEGEFAGEITRRKELAIRDRSRLALAFGVAIADGFIAVQAQEKESIEHAGRTVLKLSEALGLRSRVLKHTQAIIDASQRGDWKAVREELDKTQKTMRETMEEMRDGDLANCVSIGGWIRGTEAMASLISKAYKADQAELLNQPELAVHFSELIGEMDKLVREVEQVKAADVTLKKIATLMGDGEKVIDLESISGIRLASKSLVDTVFGIPAGGDEKEESK